jgi:hypothetical protein
MTQSRPPSSADAGPVLEAPYATPYVKERLTVRNDHDASAVRIIRARSELM